MTPEVKAASKALNDEMAANAFFDDMDEDALAEIADSMAKEAQRLSQVSGKARFMLAQRLSERGATVLDTEHWTGKVEAGAWQIVNESALYSCPGISERCFIIPDPKPPVGRWDNRALNEMHKLGGVIAEAIDASRERGEGALVLKRKEPAKEGITQ